FSRAAEREECRNEHDRLREDDRHYTRTVHLQRKELPCSATKLPVAHNLLGIVHRHLSHTLYQHNRTEDDEDENGDLNDEHEDHTCSARLRHKFLRECLWQVCKDTYHDDE